jgi:hypothetical protein
LVKCVVLATTPPQPQATIARFVPKDTIVPLTHRRLLLVVQVITVLQALQTKPLRHALTGMTALTT